MNIEHLNIMKGLNKMAPEEYQTIYDTVISKAPCNFLVFGVGKDSILWHKANKGGTTIFLENKENWIQKTREADANMKIFRVVYRTNIRSANKFLDRYKSGNKTIFDMPLPSEIINTKWDIILVDGPKGGFHSVGRMKSIYNAYKLASNSEHPIVFIHDTQRRVDRIYTSEFFGDAFELTASLRKYVL